METADRATFSRLRQWTAWLEATDHRPKTIRDYRYWILRFAADTVIDPWEATEDDIVTYLASLPKQGMIRILVLRSLRSYWSWAEPRAGRNPIARLHLRRPRSKDAPHLADETWRRVIAAAFRREARRGWAILLAYSTGARVGSLVALRPRDVGETVSFDTAKGRRTYSVATTRAVRIAVRHLEEEGHATLLGVGAEQFRNWLRQAARDAGVDKRVYPHLLRHSYGTALAKVTNPRVWQMGMGHADLSQYARYVHADMGELAVAQQAARP